MSEQVHNQSDCDTLRALIPAYSVGATDPEETALVERLLPLCPEVAAELDDYLGLAQAMLYTPTAVKPPAHLHDQLMTAVRASPAQPLAPPSATPLGAPTPALMPKPVSAPRPRVLSFNRIVAGAAAVAAALLIVSNVYWLNQVNSLRQQQQDMVALLRDQQNALASLGTGRAQHVELVSTSEGSSDVLATVAWSPQSDTARAVHRPVASALARPDLSSVGHQRLAADQRRDFPVPMHRASARSFSRRANR